MIKHLMIATPLLLGACATTTTTKQQVDCAGAEVILSDFNQPTNCNLTPPQVLTVILDDLGDAQVAECDHAGGRVLYDGIQFLCYDLDY